jgi:NDP-sugar pyrophosphorylase family protein
MKAVILAGGRGSRLKPYATVIPKPLVPIADKAILEILLNRLKDSGTDEIFLCVNHLAEIIKAFFGDGSKFGLKINYSLEEKPLSTVAPIKLIQGLPENFLVMNGDLLTDLNFKTLFDYHLTQKALLTIATYKRKVKIDFGVLGLDSKNQFAEEFIEKPIYDFNVCMGVYIMNKKVLDFVPYNEPFGFDNLMYTLLEKKQAVNVFPYDGYWLDIGRPEDYEQANIDYEKNPNLFL